MPLFVHLSVHRPKPGKAEALIEAMHRYGDAMEEYPGLREAHALRDEESGRLIGLALWESKAQWLAARPAMHAAVEDVDFESLEEAAPEVYLLRKV